MRLLSEEFTTHTAHEDLPALAGGFAGRIQWVVNGAPDGNVRILGVFEEGRCTGWALASDREAEITLTLRYTDLVALLAGDADLNALFISGAMKTDGPTGPLLDLIAAVRSEAGRRVLAELDAAVTER